MRPIHSDDVIVFMPVIERTPDDRGWQLVKGSLMELAKHSHIHTSHGQCIKRRERGICG